LAASKIDLEQAYATTWPLVLMQAYNFDMTKARRFILQAIDPDYGSPAFEAMFVVDRLEELRALLEADGIDDPEIERWYTLDATELAAIHERFGVLFDSQGREVRLERWHSLREVPYLVHTGYELPLLLEGRKQLAQMYYEYPPERHPEEDRFDRYVALGILHKEIELEPFAESIRIKARTRYEGVRTAYYTRKGEEWRIPAWKLVRQASLKSGWNEDFERLQGMLYGYEDWQNDWWIAHIRKIRAEG
jgi:hypothetical protein